MARHRLFNIFMGTGASLRIGLSSMTPATCPTPNTATVCSAAAIRIVLHKRSLGPIFSCRTEAAYFHDKDDITSNRFLAG